MLTCLLPYFLPRLCLDLNAYMFVSLLICSICFMPSSMCLCALCHVCVLKPRPCLSCHVLLQPFCSFYHIFLCFGLLVRTRSRPYRLCRRPNTEADIKGFGSPYFQVYACLLASMLYACVNLSCSRLCHA